MIKSVYNNNFSSFTKVSQTKDNEKKEIKTENIGKSDRVSELREMIKNGDYKIDIKSSAKAIAETILS